MPSAERATGTPAVADYHDPADDDHLAASGSAGRWTCGAVTDWSDGVLAASLLLEHHDAVEPGG